MAQLPTGWVYSTVVGAPGVAQIVIPAGGVGVSHVITDLTAEVLNTAGGLIQLAVQILDGATVSFQRNMITNAAAGVVDTTSFEVPFVLKGTNGTAMTIRFNASSPGIVEFVQAGGYDL